MIEIKIDPANLDSIFIEKTINYLKSLISSKPAITSVPSDIDKIDCESSPVEYASELPSAIDEQRKRLREVITSGFENIAIPEMHLPVRPQNKIETVQSDVDVTGVIWDPELHSRTKSKDADGKWKSKRKSPELVKEVSAPVKYLQEFAKGIEGSADLIKKIDKAPPPPPSELAVSFPTVMKKITQGIAQQKITHQQVVEILKAHEIESIPVLGSRPELLPQIDAALNSIIEA